MFGHPMNFTKHDKCCVIYLKPESFQNSYLTDQSIGF